MIDAVVTAGGRLPGGMRIDGTGVKALLEVGGRTMLASVIAALRGVPDIGTITVVGPSEARAAYPDVACWIDEFATGEENLIAALRAARTERIVFAASDLPFVKPSSFAGLIDLAPPDTDIAYPIYRRDEFLRAYPDGRKTFARLSDGEWTGGSAFVINRSPVLARLPDVRRSFAARKNLLALASLLGPALLARYVLGMLRIDHVERRVCSVFGANVKAVVGADPALAMDCDDMTDVAYARAGRTDP